MKSETPLDLTSRTPISAVCKVNNRVDSSLEESKGPRRQFNSINGNTNSIDMKGQQTEISAFDPRYEDNEDGNDIVQGQMGS